MKRCQPSLSPLSGVQCRQPQHDRMERPDRMAEITGIAAVLPNVWLYAVSRAPTISRALTIYARSMLPFGLFRSSRPVAAADLSGIHWAIVGGEKRPAFATDGGAVGRGD